MIIIAPFLNSLFNANSINNANAMGGEAYDKKEANMDSINAQSNLL
jgi:hypothetical protein